MPLNKQCFEKLDISYGKIIKIWRMTFKITKYKFVGSYKNVRRSNLYSWVILEDDISEQLSWKELNTE